MAGRPPKFDVVTKFSNEPIAGIRVYQQPPKESVDDLMAALEVRDIEGAKKDELLARLRLRIAEMQNRTADIEGRLGQNLPPRPPTGDSKTQTMPKRFAVVDSEVIRDDESGEYTLGEAVTLARSQKGQGTSDAVELAKLLKPGEQLTMADFTGLVQQLTTANKGKDEGMSSAELDLRLENLRLKQKEETRELIKEVAREVMPQPPAAAKEDHEPPFLTDASGNVILNPHAKLTAQDVALWQMMGQSRNVFPYVGPDGKVVPFNREDYVAIKGFEGDERRKDEDLKIKKDAIALAREHAPDAIEALRNLRGPQGSGKEALEKGGWIEGGTVPQVSRKKCGAPGCDTILEYTPGTKMIACPQCRETNLLMPMDEAEAEVRKWSAAFQLGPSIESTLNSEGSTGATSEPESGEASSPSSEPSRSRASEESS